MELLFAARQATVFFSSHAWPMWSRFATMGGALPGRLLLRSSLESLSNSRLPRYRIGPRGPPPAGAELRAPALARSRSKPGWLLKRHGRPGMQRRLPLLAGCGAVVTSYEREHEDLEMIFLKLLREAGYGENEGGMAGENALR